MKVTIFTQHYEPERCCAAERITSMAKHFASCGFAVEVVTGFPRDCEGNVFEAYRHKFFTVERDIGVRATRIRVYRATRDGAFHRALNWLSVVVGCSLLSLLRLRDTGAVYVSIPPASLAVPALIAAWAARAPVFVDVPDACAELADEAPRSGPIALLTASMFARLLRRAQIVFCATEEIRDAVMAKYPSAKDVRLVTNGFDRTEPATAPPFERGDRFVAVYAGGMGPGSGLDVVLDAAALLRDDRIAFVLMGEGSETQRLRERARAEGLADVHFTGSAASPLILAALRDADVSVVSLDERRPDALPGEMFDALSVGCPVVVLGAGPAQRRFVERSGACWCVPAADAEALARTIRDAKADREASRERGRAGREYVLEHFDRSRSASRVVHAIFGSAFRLMKNADIRSAAMKTRRDWTVS